jgi:hypothetical protein
MCVFGYVSAFFVEDMRRYTEKKVLKTGLPINKVEIEV